MIAKKFSTSYYNPSEEEVSQGLFDVTPENQQINKKFLELPEATKTAVESTSPEQIDDEATQLIKELPKDQPPTPEQKESLKSKLGSMLEGENYINYTLPILGIVEAIATQGKSPGTTALAMQSKAREAQEHGLTMEEKRAEMAANKDKRRSESLARKNEEMMRNELSALPWDTDPEEAEKKAEKIVIKYGEAKDIMTNARFKDRSKSGGLFAGWKAKVEERDKINSGINPYNGDKPIENEAELNSAKDEWERTWATSTALGITPKYIKGAAEKAKTVQLAQIPGKVKEAGASAEARNLAPEKLSIGALGDLTTSQGIYANLENAKEKFKNEFATPFAGKIMKLAYLRRTNPEFASFISSLGLAMNEYRRQNFGTAQTNSEIQNFLDIISTDTDITPEAFQSQLGTVMSAMQRDYGYKTQNFESSKYVVPESAKNIQQPVKQETSGGSAIDQLKEKARTGDVKAQSYLKSKNIQW